MGASISMMTPTGRGGLRKMRLPESDPKGILTPDPPACPKFAEGDGLGSGRVTPTYAALAGRGLFQELCEGVSSKLQHIQEQQQEEAGHGRKRLSGETEHSGLRLAISAVEPPGKLPQPAILSLGSLLPQPAEVQPHKASLGAPPGLGEGPSAAREVVSVGTLGHPHSCSEPCKYQKRKTGCLMGASCHRCHLCHWHRHGKTPWRAVEHAPPPPPPPVATHPRPATWRTGAAPQPPPSRPAVSREEPAYVHVRPEAASLVALDGVIATAPAASAEAVPVTASVSPFPSVGSVGHPHGCGRACKYAGKANGCKVGHLCDRCHLCRWTRSKEHAYAAGMA